MDGEGGVEPYSSHVVQIVMVMAVVVVVVASFC